MVSNLTEARGVCDIEFIAHIKSCTGSTYASSTGHGHVWVSTYIAHCISVRQSDEKYIRIGHRLVTSKKKKHTVVMIVVEELDRMAHQIVSLLVT